MNCPASCPASKLAAIPGETTVPRELTVWRFAASMADDAPGDRGPLFPLLISLPSTLCGLARAGPGDDDDEDDDDNNKEKGDDGNIDPDDDEGFDDDEDDDDGEEPLRCTVMRRGYRCNAA